MGTSKISVPNKFEKHTKIIWNYKTDDLGHCFFLSRDGHNKVYNSPPHTQELFFYYIREAISGMHILNWATCHSSFLSSLYSPSMLIGKVIFMIRYLSAITCWVRYKGVTRWCQKLDCHVIALSTHRLGLHRQDAALINT